MRVIAYNILDGGEGRADPLAEVIEAQRADIVALVEADNLSVIERIAARSGMDYIYAPTGGHAGAILSRWPMATSVNHAVGNGHWMNAFVEATVVDPAGLEWTVVAVHFAAHASLERETLREQQLDALLSRLAPLQGRSHILAGDFNSNAPSQRIDPAKCKPRTQDEWVANGGMIPRRVIQRLLDAGYVDTLDAADPKSALTAGTFTTQFPEQRIDYIFAHGIEPPRITAAWIEHDRLAKYASDHFPVGAEII